MAEDAATPPGEPDHVVRARKLLQDAIARSRPDAGPSVPLPMARPSPVPGMKVDKYFGTDLPPVCAELGCYVSDDGKRFYCVNPRCQKHKKRATKHTRRGNPRKPVIVYFRCPRCESRNIEMHVLANRYACRACKHTWEK
ncbi:MAG TPA: hypothetical protein VM286_00225 [Candidatus Thermoplasmatota archaeon]|nr:hypothetical protein [Candidatus Thermoplasmatota archaeon]